MLELVFGVDHAGSLLLLGDNGVGKSSLVEALEFGLRGIVSGRPNAVEYTRCALTDQNPSVRVTFDDGSSVERYVAPSGGGVARVAVNGSAPGFGLSPFLIRRSDLERFWDPAPHTRDRLFTPYLAIIQSNQRLRHDLSEESSLRATIAELIGAPPETIAELSPDERGALLGRTGPVWDRLGVPRPGLGWPPQELRSLLRSYAAVASRLEGLSDDQRKMALSGEDLRAAEILEEVAAGVLSAFTRATSNRAIRDIELRVVLEPSPNINIFGRLPDGRRVWPPHVVSEANLDVLALFVFVGLVKSASERGQAKVLILDDVLQSVDAPLRVLIIDHLLEVLPDWQFVIVVHDRLWHEQLRSLFRRRNLPVECAEIIRWTHTTGPVLREGGGHLAVGLENALRDGTPQEICAAAGVLLERTCDALSRALRISVRRQETDQYTLGELWPGIRKATRRTTLHDRVEAVEMWLALRNIAGCHWNEWAAALSTSEAEQLGSAVADLVRHVRCDRCSHWIAWRGPTPASLRCVCGSVAVSEAGGEAAAGALMQGHGVSAGASG